MLEAVGLECVRGDRTLFRDVGFGVARGEIMQVQGANGSGKTSLLRTLCGMTMPAAGEIRWDGEGIRSLGEEYHRALTYLGHLNAVKDELSGLENLRITCAMSGIELDEAEAWDALERIGLGGRENLPAKVLSQGQRRRVALARLLVSRTPLWILDEPLTALDRAAVALVQDVIRGHLQAGGLVIFTTHQDLEVRGVEIRRLVLGG